MKEKLLTIELRDKNRKMVTENIHSGEKLIFSSDDELFLKKIVYSVMGIEQSDCIKKIIIFGNDLSILNEKKKIEIRKNIGFVSFSASKLINNLTLYENLAIPLEFLKGFKNDEIENEIVEFATKYGLRDDLSKLPASISESNYRISLLLRTIILKPSLIILGELLENLRETELNLLDDALKSDRISFLGVSMEQNCRIDAKVVEV